MKIYINRFGKEIYRDLLSKRHKNPLGPLFGKYEKKGFAKIYEEYYKANEPGYWEDLVRLKEKLAKLSPSPKVLLKRDDWFRIHFKPRQAPRKIIGIFKITYKEYFTFFLDPKATKVGLDKMGDLGLPSFIRIHHFLNRLILPIAEELNKLNQQEEESISLKIRDSLEGLIIHPDSIVIHFSKKSTGRKVRKIVEAVDRRETVFLLGRGVKEKGGFDLSSSKLRLSHGQLLGKLISGELHLDPPRGWRSKEIMKRWLKKQLEKFKDIGETETLALIELEDRKIEEIVFKEDYLKS